MNGKSLRKHGEVRRLAPLRVVTDHEQATTRTADRDVEQVDRMRSRVSRLLAGWGCQGRAWVDCHSVHTQLQAVKEITDALGHQPIHAPERR
jgi:hypothetical protein